MGPVREAAQVRWLGPTHWIRLTSQQKPDCNHSASTDCWRYDNALHDALRVVRVDATICNVCTRQPTAPRHQIEFRMPIALARRG